MKILQINTVYGKGSTGKIAYQLHEICVQNGIECRTAYRYEENNIFEDTYETSSWFDTHAHNRIAKITLCQGLFSKQKTKQFLKKVDDFSPDIIHLHNIHGNYIHLPSLFKYLSKHEIKTIWTLHDCWAFTGHCAHFTFDKCNGWQEGCKDCPLFREKIKKLIIKKMYFLKKKMFLKVSNISIVTPSKWLADLVKTSYLREYDIRVINNGIDLTIFRPTESDFRQRFCCIGKKIILGVAFDWGEKKGLDVFIELAKKLDDKYQIVLVGTNSRIDEHLPCNIISIHKTQNQIELAEIYTAADLFVNPTREDTYPTVNMEAIACGTPVLTFKTGGSPEIIDEICGAVVECDDIDTMISTIENLCENSITLVNGCLNKSREFDMNDKFKEYIKLYENSTYST